MTDNSEKLTNAERDYLTDRREFVSTSDPAFIDKRKQMFDEQVDDTLGYFMESFGYGDPQKVHQLQELLKAEAGTIEGEAHRLLEIGRLVNALVVTKCMPTNQDVVDEL